MGDVQKAAPASLERVKEDDLRAFIAGVQGRLEGSRAFLSSDAAS